MQIESLTVGQVGVSVSDLGRATAFYRDKVGLSFLFEAAGMAFFDCGNLRLMLSSAKTGEVYSSIVYYKTSDIHALVQRMKQRGVAFEQEARVIAKMPDHELWMAFFRDSGNNLCGLMSEVH